MQHPYAHLLLFLSASVSPALAAGPGTGADPGLDCVILPDEQVEMSSPVPGVIEAVLVRRSERVARGQVLARLESSVEEATVALAGARAQTDAEARLRQVELDYDAKHRNRLQALHASQAVSAQNREDAERVATVARLRLRLAEDRRREAVLERRRAAAVLALKTLRSPIDGVIVERLRTVGEYVEDRPILRIARLDPLRVEVIAPLALFGVVHEGMRLGVRPETDPEHERVATVRAVDPVADPGSGTFGIQLELPNPGLELPAGIKCKGRLLASRAVAPAHPDPDDVSAAAFEASSENQRPARPVPVPGAEKTAAVAPAQAPAGACLTYEGLHDEATARSLARAAERLGARAETRQAMAKRVVGYVVMTPAGSGAEPRRGLESRLRAAGIRDFAVIGRGENAGRIALGVYNGPRSAERRRAALATLGFEAEVVPRTRDRRLWQVALWPAAGLEPERLRAELAGIDGLPAAETGPCEPLRTAAR